MLMSLGDNTDRDLFTSEEERSDYLRRVFTRNHNFRHRKNIFTYVYDETIEGLLVAWISRAREETILGAPETRFEPQRVEAWKIARVILDTNDDKRGQRVAIDHNTVVGAPLAIFRSLANWLNQSDPAPPWVISVNPIIEETDFWQVVEQHGTDLTELKFTLAVPNVLGIEGELNEELQSMKTEEHAQEVELIIKGKRRPIRANTKRVRALVDYANQGGGRIVAKAGSKKIYDSDSKVKKRELQNDVKSSIREIVVNVARWLRR